MAALDEDRHGHRPAAPVPPDPARLAGAVGHRGRTPAAEPTRRPSPAARRLPGGGGRRPGPGRQGGCAGGAEPDPGRGAPAAGAGGAGRRARGRRAMRSGPSPAGRGGPWGPVGTARRQFDELAESGSRRLLEGADAVGAARTFMGGDGSRRYLAALQNNAEMRNQGAILSYVVLRFSDGRFAVERRGSTNELALGRTGRHPPSRRHPRGVRLDPPHAALAVGERHRRLRAERAVDGRHVPGRHRRAARRRRSPSTCRRWPACCA